LVARQQQQQKEYDEREPARVVQAFAERWLSRFTDADRDLLEQARDFSDHSHINQLHAIGRAQNLLFEFDADARAVQVTNRDFVSENPFFWEHRNLSNLDNPFRHRESIQGFVDEALDTWAELRAKEYPGQKNGTYLTEFKRVLMPLLRTHKRSRMEREAEEKERAQTRGKRLKKELLEIGATSKTRNVRVSKRSVGTMNTALPTKGARKKREGAADATFSYNKTLRPMKKRELPPRNRRSTRILETTEPLRDDESATDPASPDANDQDEESEGDPVGIDFLDDEG
jgi:hypothetical protein